VELLGDDSSLDGEGDDLFAAPASSLGALLRRSGGGGSATLSSLVRGPLSLGSLLEQHGYAATPSASHPTPVSEDALRSTLSEALAGISASSPETTTPAKTTLMCTPMTASTTAMVLPRSAPLAPTPTPTAPAAAAAPTAAAAAAAAAAASTSLPPPTTTPTPHPPTGAPPLSLRTDACAAASPCLVAAARLTLSATPSTMRARAWPLAAPRGRPAALVSRSILPSAWARRENTACSGREL